MSAQHLKIGDIFKIRQDGGLWEVIADRGTVLDVRSELGTVRKLRKKIQVIID